jgi:SprB repeat
MPLTITPGTITHAAAAGSATGAIAATTVSGGVAPYTYTWTSSGAGASTITSNTAAAKTALKAGTYRITVTDSTPTTPLTAFKDYVVKVQTYTGLTFTPGAIHHYVEEGEYLADIKACTVSGGTPGYTVKWTSSSTKITDMTLGAKVGLEPGSYTVTVTDTDALGVIHTFVLHNHKKLYHGPGGWTTHDPLH